jgi:Arc/MetJ-type ribon-helix-helix transcriptional regulator
MTIKITPEVEQLVEGIYSDGKYASPSEVLTTALVLLQQREQLRKDLEVGARELDNGQRLDADQVFADLKRRATELGEATQ